MFQTTKSSASTQIARISHLSKRAKLSLLLMTLTTATIFFFVFKGIISHELNHAYTADSPLYWAVGRGILNGLKPFIDMYENKPIGVFLISALSFALTDDTIICNIVSIIAALMIAILPALAIWSDLRREDNNSMTVIKNAAVFFSVLLCGLMLSSYSTKQSGSFQCEEIGSAFSILFILFVKQLKTARSRRKRILFTAASALAISCAVMIKEPFLIISVFGALLFVDSMKEFLKHIVLPCVAGSTLILTILAASGLLVPYFTIYIKRIFETRLSGSSSAFSRTGNLLILCKDIWIINRLFFFIILIFFFLALLRAFLFRKNPVRFTVDLIKIIAAIFAASFCVGMGGQYYNHHLIFAVPVYCAYIIYGGGFLCKIEPQGKHVTKAAILLLIMAMFSAQTDIGKNYKSSIFPFDYDAMIDKAQYVDSLLDFYGAERYQFVGFNGLYQFYGLTKHSPQGPMFVQDPDNFINKDTWAYLSFAEQLDKSDIIIVDDYSAPGIKQMVEELVDTEFTETPAKTFDESLPDDFEYKIYFRTSVYG